MRNYKVRSKGSQALT